jgi:hypothetical protein
MRQWSEAGKSLRDHKELYQDRFLILSAGWYSGVPPEAIDLSDAEWLERSLVIRREHECAHYWTRRVLHSMRNSIIDEIIADYCGVLKAVGTFRADWLLLFLGLERFPELRSDGRLRNYRGSPPLSDDAFRLLQRLVVRAATNLEAFHKVHQATLSGDSGTLLILLTLSQFTLEELAASNATERLGDELEHCSRAYLPDLATANPHPIGELYAKSSTNVRSAGRS